VVEAELKGSRESIGTPVYRPTGRGLREQEVQRPRLRPPAPATTARKRPRSTDDRLARARSRGPFHQGEQPVPFQPRPELIKALQSVAEDLFETTRPGRVTIRVDATNDPDYPVLGEARADGVASITGGMSLIGYKPIDIHTATTVIVLRDRREKIVQNDVRTDPPRIPELLDYYGCLSQILIPIEWKGRFVGVVSIHGVDPREWTADDIAAAEEAARQVEAELEGAAWFEVDR
jgi:hypothetical protein